MDWTPGGLSDDIEDRRDSSGGGGGGFGGGGLGIAGFVVLLILSLVTGRNFLGSFFSGSGVGPQVGTQQAAPVGAPRTHPPGEDRDVQLISFVLDDAQKTWTQIFAAAGKPYRHAKLVIFRDQTPSGCGRAEAATGPFYCPQDEKVYIDLSFWEELKRFGGDTGDFAQAYVIAHELGHHVQKLLGMEAREQRLVQTDPSERNALSVDLELQADCFAGVWAHSTEQRKIVDDADVEGALKAAAAVGDDHLQRMSGRAVSPENFTHGTSAQRMTWFKRGLTSGTVGACTTFNGHLAPGE
jgi:predicted metalloprotease